MAKNTSKQAVVETLKELARVVLLGAVSACLSWLATQVANLDPNSLYALVGTLVLRLADKYVHTNDNISAKGLAPF